MLLEKCAETAPVRTQLPEGTNVVRERQPKILNDVNDGTKPPSARGKMGVSSTSGGISHRGY